MDIVYLKDPKEFLAPFRLKDRTDELSRALRYFDYAGGIVLPKNLIDEKIKLFPTQIVNSLERLCNEKEGKVYFRSKRYYLNFVYDNDVDTVKKEISKNLPQVSENINLLSELNFSSEIETKLIIAAFLDLKKHYSMCILNSIFMHMLKEKADIKIYEDAKKSCIRDISNFYSFIFADKINEQRESSKDVLKLFCESKYPESTPPSLFKAEGEPAARRLIVREMDHPMQIILFAGNLLNEDKDDTIDMVVNPLSGALEIGYALKSIYDIIGLNKINDIFLVKYSHYGENDSIKDSIDSFVPTIFSSQLEKIKGQRVIIIDDNIFTGETLYNLREMFSLYTENVRIAAIEAGPTTKNKPKIELNDLNIKPISKLRYIERVVEFIKDNNLYGL